MDIEKIRTYPGCPACADTILELCTEVEQLRAQVDAYKLQATLSASIADQYKTDLHATEGNLSYYRQVADELAAKVDEIKARYLNERSTP